MSKQEAAKTVREGCWHNAGYHDFSMCKDCRLKVERFILGT